MRIVAISDTHNLHDAVDVPPGDVLIHAGDLTNQGSLDDVRAFDELLAGLPHQHKIVVAGNHDFCFERRPQVARAALRHALYLQDEAVTIDGIRFYGSPWQPWFYDWAFNLQRGPEIRAKWDLIPADTDVLITHGPPLGHGDRNVHGEPVGCADLHQRVQQVGPRYHVFGHIHEGYGTTSNGTTTFVNASVCDFRYHPVNPPQVFDLAGRSGLTGDRYPGE